MDAEAIFAATVAQNVLISFVFTVVMYSTGMIGLVLSALAGIGVFLCLIGLLFILAVLFS